MVPIWMMIATGALFGVTGFLASELIALRHEINMASQYLKSLGTAIEVIESYKRMLAESEAKNGKQ